MVEEGDVVEDSTLEGAADGEIRTFSLSEAIGDGRPVTLAFYVYDFNPVCTDQICEVDDMEILTLNDDTAAFGVSRDGPYSHLRFAEEHGISYPLLSDPDLDVYERFGMVEVDEEGRRRPRRGIAVVGPDRTLRYRWVAADTLEEWRIDPLTEANEVVTGIVGT